MSSKGSSRDPGVEEDSYRRSNMEITVLSPLSIDR
jgi:hypothetical protein